VRQGEFFKISNAEIHENPFPAFQLSSFLLGGLGVLAVKTLLAVAAGSV
jgi:hypothetical protein